MTEPPLPKSERIMCAIVVTILILAAVWISVGLK